MKYFKSILFGCLCLISAYGFAQPKSQGYWQQHVNYEMEIDMDVNTHRFTGKQKLVYTNNSPDTLTKAYYHLYFNAFQPGSMMDVRSLNIADPDGRVGSRISKLNEDEIGYQHINSLKQNGKTASYKIEGTILSVILPEPILPGGKATFEMDFDGQVPIQIRRSGRDNAEGISYSMSQWYPKLAEYDYLGWHTNPYIGREFHGVWGDFDVKITIDPNYVIGGTGYLQNPNKIGHGYQKEGKTVAKSTKPLTWHFVAPNVHDFMWAADPDYTHTKIDGPNGTTLHFFYQKNASTEENWGKLPAMMAKAMEFMNTNFGVYPYKQYSFVQGGDGGMEYPMSTLITGNRNFNSLLGVSVHEMIHSWFQGALATNESLYPWIDEGFTSYASSATMTHLLNPNATGNIHLGSHRGYHFMANSGKEEPLATHADHYHTNQFCRSYK
ncbi:MAG: M1 family metallopeptidase [Bacteroidota bacterium]